MATRTKTAKSYSSSSKKKKSSSVAEALRDEVLNLKRDHILREAAALFYERGYLQTSVDAIVERLDATKPFFYYHFSSKADLLVEICVRATSDALAATEQAVSQGGAAGDRFVAFVRGFTRSALENHNFVAIYFREEFNLPSEATSRIHAMRKTIDRRLRTLIADGVEAGEFEVPDSGIAALLVAGMSSYAFAWYRDKGRLGMDSVVDQIVQMALKMVKKPA